MLLYRPPRISQDGTMASTASKKSKSANARTNQQTSPIKAGAHLTFTEPGDEPEAVISRLDAALGSGDSDLPSQFLTEEDRGSPVWISQHMEEREEPVPEEGEEASEEGGDEPEEEEKQQVSKEGEGEMEEEEGEEEEEDEEDEDEEEEEEEDMSVVEGLNVTLLPHQIRGLAFLLSREEGKARGGILADDVGAALSWLLGV